MSKAVDLKTFIPDPIKVTLRDGTVVHLLDPTDIPYANFLELTDIGMKLQENANSPRDVVELMAKQIYYVVPEFESVEQVHARLTMRDMMEMTRVISTMTAQVSEGNAEATTSLSNTPPSSLQ